MNQGMSVSQWAQKIEEQNSLNKDYIVQSSYIKMSSPDVLKIETVGEFDVKPIAHDQIATTATIPNKFYKALKEEFPDIFVDTVNAFLPKRTQRRMIRTQGQHARAMLSDRYRPLDNLLAAKAIVPILNDRNLLVKSASITDESMYLHVVDPKLEGEIKKGETIQGGVVISNSEVGLGAFKVEAFLYFLACTNGMIGSNSISRRHIGRRIKEQDVNETYDFYHKDTIEADNLAFALKARDTVEQALDEVNFQRQLDALLKANEEELDRAKLSAKENPIIELIVNSNFAEKDGEAIWGNLLLSNDYTRLGLANAITSYANTLDDFNKIVAIERFGGEVAFGNIEL